MRLLILLSIFFLAFSATAQPQEEQGEFWVEWIGQPEAASHLVKWGHTEGVWEHTTDWPLDKPQLQCKFNPAQLCYQAKITNELCSKGTLYVTVTSRDEEGSEGYPGEVLSGRPRPGGTGPLCPLTAPKIYRADGGS